MEFKQHIDWLLRCLASIVGAFILVTGKHQRQAKTDQMWRFALLKTSCNNSRLEFQCLHLRARICARVFSILLLSGPILRIAFFPRSRSKSSILWNRCSALCQFTLGANATASCKRLSWRFYCSFKWVWLETLSTKLSPQITLNETLENMGGAGNIQAATQLKIILYGFNSFPGITVRILYSWPCNR